LQDITFNRGGLDGKSELASHTVESSLNPVISESLADSRNEQSPYPWILHPVIDILFCCGGLFWLIYAFWALSGMQVSLYGNASAFTLAFINIVGLQLLGDSHSPATLWRVYFSKSTRQKLGLPVAIFGFFALSAGLCAVLVPSTTPFLFKLVMCWGFQHQLAQAYGVALIYCYKRKYFLNPIEKKIMLSMIQCTIIYMVVRMLSIRDFGNAVINGYVVSFWSVLPEWTSAVALGALQISVLLFALMVVRKYVKEKQLLPLPAMLNLMTAVFMSFMTAKPFLAMWFLFSQWYFHSSQYLVVTSAFYLKERGLPENLPLSKISQMLCRKAFAIYFGALFTFGFCVFYLLPLWLADHGVQRAMAFGGIWIAFNLHHYITDAFIWRLRDPQLQKLLIA
jgi:hypothetical protein